MKTIPWMDIPDVFLGEYDEPTNAAKFDAYFENSRWFKVESEVWGDYLHCLPNQKPARPRIDRILIPTKLAITKGWKLGAIGVELKAGNHRAGPAICQAIDYRRACFYLQSGFVVLLKHVFLHPIVRQKKTAASVMSQNNIGSSYITPHGELFFYDDATMVLSVSPTGECLLGKTTGAGAKRGSR